MIKVILIISCLFFTLSCGSGTSGGNPGVTSRVTIESGPYTNDGSLVMISNPYLKGIENFLISTAFAAVPITDFQFCVTKMKVKTEGESTVGVSLEAKLGLVNVSDANATTNWGQINLTKGASISEIHFEIHQDSETCSGENFTVSYNGQTITKDLEFKFRFNPAVSVNDGDTFKLGLSKIAKAVEDARAAGQFNNENISPYLENVFGDGEEL